MNELIYLTIQAFKSGELNLHESIKLLAIFSIDEKSAREKLCE